MKRLAVLGILILALVAACSGSQTPAFITPNAPDEPVDAGPGLEMPLVGRPAPDFAIEESEGLPAGTAKLSDLEGGVVVLNFWATWCGYCVKEIPTMEKLHQKYQDQGVVIAGVDVGETPKQVAEFKKKVPFTYPLIFDLNQSIFEKYWGRALPVTFIVDQEGIIRAILFGETSQKTFEAAIEPLLP